MLCFLKTSPSPFLPLSLSEPCSNPFSQIFFFLLGLLFRKLHMQSKPHLVNCFVDCEERTCTCYAGLCQNLYMMHVVFTSETPDCSGWNIFCPESRMGNPMQLRGCCEKMWHIFSWKMLFQQNHQMTHVKNGFFKLSSHWAWEGKFTFVPIQNRINFVTQLEIK